MFKFLLILKSLLKPTGKLFDKTQTFSLTHGSPHVTPPQWQAQRGRIPAGANYGVDQDGAHVAEEELVGHGVTRIQDDLRQQVEEKDSRGQGEGWHVVRGPNDSTQEEAEADEQGALRDHAGHVVVGLDDCKRSVVFLEIRHACQ